jgi:hypothetical protein
MQIVEGATLDALGVEEKVFLAPNLDESEAFVRQLFYSAFSHFCVLQGICLDERQPAYFAG